MKLYDFWSSVHGRMPEIGLDALKSFIPIGDKEGYAFPIEGAGRIYVTGDSFCQKTKSGSLIDILHIGSQQHSYSFRRLFYCDCFPGRLCAEIYDHWDGVLNIVPFDELAHRDKYDFINELCMLNEEVINDIDQYNDSHSNKTLRIEKSDKYSVDSFVRRVRAAAGLFAELKVYQTLTRDYEARTVIEVPGALRGMEGIKKIVVDSDREKEHIKWIYLYGELNEDEDNTIPRLLLEEYHTILHSIGREDGERRLMYSVIENHLNSIEKDAFRHFIAHIKEEYGSLFRLDIENVFVDVCDVDSVVKELPGYSYVLSNLPAKFKEGFSKRLIEDIPLTSSQLDINALTHLFGEIVQNRLITLPYYKHYNIILNLLDSELCKYIKHDAINQLSGSCILYTDEEPDYSKGEDILVDTVEINEQKGATILNINEKKLRSLVGEECLKYLDDLANPDFNSTFLAKEPLKEFLWWGDIGPASFSPDVPNELNEYGYRLISVEYPIIERVPSSSFFDFTPSAPIPEKGVASFCNILCNLLSIDECKATIITETKEPDGSMSTRIELPNFKHGYRTITLTYHDCDHIEGIVLNGIKLYEIANSFAGSFLGFPVELIMEQTDSLSQYLFFRVLV